MSSPIPFDQFTFKTLDDRETTLAEFRHRVLLIVNVASQCGFTPQYAGLESLYRTHRDAGLTILGFPCNQFLSQEPGDEAAIGAFCKRTYDVTFPVFAKIEVNGANTHPLYQFLKSERPGLFGTKSIKWNFTKFLVDRQGFVVKRFGPNVKPQAMEKEIVKRLEQPTS
ncbi:MAG: glutathione peroxidase [Gemmataceae bacterium]